MGRGAVAAGAVPACRERESTASPATNCSPTASSHCPSPPMRAAVAAAEAARASRVSRVCFGAPVEPEVRTTATTSAEPPREGSVASGPGKRPPVRGELHRRPGPVQRGRQGGPGVVELGLGEGHQK